FPVPPGPFPVPPGPARDRPAAFPGGVPWPGPPAGATIRRGARNGPSRPTARLLTPAPEWDNDPERWPARAGSSRPPDGATASLASPGETAGNTAPAARARTCENSRGNPCDGWQGRCTPTSETVGPSPVRH